MPGQISARLSFETGLDALEYELLAEKASALGRVGERAEVSLALLKAHDGDAETRSALVKAAAKAVYAWFIQRELCGMRRHDDIIRQHQIPREVLVRLGAV